MLWIDKYTPTNLEEFPQQTEINEILKNLNQKAVLIHGPIGCGKTCIAHIIGKHYNYEITELNASSFRSKKNIEETLGKAIYQQSLFQQDKLIIIDEADATAGRKDYGSSSAIVKIIQSAQKLKHIKILLTANKLEAKAIKDIKKKCKVIEIPAPTTQQIESILKSIADKENLTYNPSDLKSLAYCSSGDIRSAILDLYSHTRKNNTLNLEHLESRKPEETLKHALRIIFKSKNYQIPQTELNNSEASLDDISLWIKENLPYEYTYPKDLYNAYNILSKSAVFKGRIMKRQNWHFLVYQKVLLSSGIALAKEQKYTNTKDYKRPMLPLKIWMSKQKNNNKQSISSKLGPLLHLSPKYIFKNFKTYSPIIKTTPIKSLDLSENEIEFLNR